MNEIEAKILEIDSQDIQKKLISLGAEKTFEGEVVWTAFDFPDRRFSEQEVLIRLRKLGKENLFTVKRLVEAKEAKVSQELEVKIDDYNTMEKILRLLGLEEKRGYPMNKHRISYTFDNAKFEIDTFQEFPTYLEIEAPSAKVIQDFAEKLGFSKKDLKPWGVREVFAHYRNAK